jgi:sulfite exporter TauE/SafE
LTTVLAMLVLGVLSSVHCGAMCGGIVTAFSTAAPLRPRTELLARQAAFNAGRISTYAALGGLAGALGSVGALASEALAAQTALYIFANATLVLVGVHLAGFGGPLARLEALAASLWRRVQPLASRLLPAPGWPRAYAAGLLWGLLPCGLVYGALAVAIFAGSALDGALGMLAFGAGTLPVLVATGAAAAGARSWLRRRAVRAGAGALVLAFGTYGLANAGSVAEGLRRGILCL